jgi:hypothetical protein
MRLVNNSHIFWQVASSAGTKIHTVVADIDAEMVKLIASKIGADPEPRSTWRVPASLRWTSPWRRCRAAPS